MRASPQPPVTPCRTDSRQQLAAPLSTRKDAAAREQLRFERICARELLGEID